MKIEKGVKYYSSLEPSGYGLSALAYIESLLEMGARVYWTPLVQCEQRYMPWTWLEQPHEQVSALIEACVDDGVRVAKLIQCLKPIHSYQCVVMHTVPEYWPQLIEPGGYHVGYTVWETSQLPQHFPELINQVDKVLVPARFNRSVFEHSGVTVPVEVVPHILEIKNQMPVLQATRKPADKQNSFVFYSINVWSARKALWTLLHCYLKGFNGDDSVELCLKTSLTGPADERDAELHNTETLVREIKEQYSNPAKIRVIRDRMSAQEIASLHRDGDCYISATHSEGWGLGAFEAAGYGNPVIMTGWGGQLDFLPENLAYLIRCRLVNVEDKHGVDSYSADQCWATVDEAHTVELMREVYQYPERARKRARTLAINLKKEFSSERIGRKLYKAIFSQYDS